jgi:hypothetical protein
MFFLTRPTSLCLISTILNKTKTLVNTTLLKVFLSTGIDIAENLRILES